MVILLLLCINNLVLFFKEFMFKIFYRFLLERPNNYYYGKESIIDIPNDENLVVIMRKFLESYKLINKSIIISLSGGVDSMVVLATLLKLKNELSLDIHIVMINYNLRFDSYYESCFIRGYCNYHKIPVMIKHIPKLLKDRRKLGSSKRKEYEENSKNIRFTAYKSLIEEFKCEGVLVGHHQDDILENIFTNIMKGHELLDLEVMKFSGFNNSVRIFRPFLNNKKSEIIEFANKYNIPYFKDTTPKWSRRGKLRNEVFPLFDNVFGEGWRKKLKEVGDQSNNWSKIAYDYIVEPWIEKLDLSNLIPVRNDYNFLFMFPVMYTKDVNIWKYTIPKFFFKIGLNTISKKQIEKLYDFTKSKKSDGLLIINENISALLTKDNNNNKFVIILRKKDYSI